jgi:hypothetical protein
MWSKTNTKNSSSQAEITGKIDSSLLIKPARCVETEALQMQHRQSGNVCENFREWMVLV